LSGKRGPRQDRTADEPEAQEAKKRKEEPNPEPSRLISVPSSEAHNATSSEAHKAKPKDKQENVFIVERILRMKKRGNKVCLFDYDPCRKAHP
jgi:hypothetical protein